jgi:hypothetical protein
VRDGWGTRAFVVDWKRKRKTTGKATAMATIGDRELKKRREGKPLFFSLDQADWDSSFRSGRRT